MQKRPISNIRILKFYSEMSLEKKKALFAEQNKSYTKELDGKIKSVLKTRPVRSLSGISNVSILTKPYPCPGNCIYCPEEKNVPKSYLSNEPAVMRAIMNNYDPAKQIRARIKGLTLAGHPTDKIELRIIGGTWSYYPYNYQENFIKSCFRECNESKLKKDLKEEQRKNEKAKHRIIGMSVETRPDFINKKEIEKLRYLGVTSVELGVQSIYNDVLKEVKRGHDVSTTIEATKMLKDAGFKICYQMMPGLPLSNPKRDLEMFQEIFKNPDFKPDFLKIYPVMVIKNTKLYKLWKEGEYHPYPDEELTSLIKKIKENIPYYVRIQRVIRDIPSQSVEAGTKVSNLRQIIKDETTKEEIQCKCIRCREIKGNYDPKEKIKIFRENYDASGGKEIFLSFEDYKRRNVYGILRMRIINNSAIIREVHTYGQHLSLQSRSEKQSPQHQGLGKKLMKEAEKIAIREFKAPEISIISGVGVREYYRKLGYRLKNTYMVKKTSSLSN